MRFLPLLALLLGGCPTGTDKDTESSEDSAEEDVDSVGECETTAACGGDAVGTWTIASACMIADLSSEECPAATIEVAGLTITGSVTLGADGTYTVDTTSQSMVIEASVPASCTGGMACADFAEMVSGTCVDAADADGCDCSITQTGEPSTESGTFVAAGTSVTLTPDDGSDPETADYCADADELWLSIPNAEDPSASVRMLLTR